MTAEYLGPDGGYSIDGDDLDHVRKVTHWTDADGVKHTKECVMSYSTFRLWNRRAVAVIEEVERRRAEAHIANLPARKRVAAR